MILSLEKIKQFFPRVNLRCHDNNDFWRVARELKIVVIEEPLLIDGYYQVKRNKPHILINKDLKGLEWTLTAFHELTHHFLDVPPKKDSIILYRNAQAIESMRDQRAEDIALILTIPKGKLFEMQDTPFDQLDPYSQEVLKKRQHVYERYKEIEDDM